jgi:hypothetical protein
MVGMSVLLILPPMTQVNTPYPATAFLTGFLRTRGIACAQADFAIELVLRLFSRDGLVRAGSVLQAVSPSSPPLDHFRAYAATYEATIDPVIRFLQGRDPSLALRIVSRTFLPEGPRFAALEAMDDQMHWAFGTLGLQDQAKYLATLYLADLTDVIRDGIDPRFELTRYAEKLAISAPTFDTLHAALHQPPTLVDTLLAEITRDHLARNQPRLVGITTPFPGNVYGALRIAQTIRTVDPSIRIAWGGGYPNTELRELKDPRVFDFVDYVTLDSGELPLLRILDAMATRPGTCLHKTFTRANGAVVFHHDADAIPLPHTETGTPTYDGLPMDRYLYVFDTLNPMHRIWSDGRWNKLMVAHGCYWSQCTFCDTRLDYIDRFSKAPARLLADRMEALIAETGQTGFHFVDEAAPPAMLKALSEEILHRGLVCTWWGNIRFEKSYTPELCALMASAGCVAVSGGLEVAEDRLLALIKKGVTVEQVARVTHAFTEAGIMVHAYLMYGYPTQTVQETVNSLEMVRQLFEAGCIQSGFWHRFALTAHSPIAADPAAFGITLLPEPEVTFARNEIPFHDPVKADHDRLGDGLRKALFNYMHGVGFDVPVHTWFSRKTSRTTIDPGFIETALRNAPETHPSVRS